MKNLKCNIGIGNNLNILYEGNTLEQFDSSCGYKMVSLGDSKNVYYVHRLVAEMLVANPDRDVFTVVNHKDGNKHNNCPDNLEWVTPSYNLYHSHHILGRKAKKSSVSEEVIREICELIQGGSRNKEIRSRFKDLPKTFLSELRSGRTYKNISKDYEMKLDRSKRLSDAKVLWVCRKLEEGMTPTEISELSRVPIPVHTIEKIKSRDNFKELSRDFKF